MNEVTFTGYYESLPKRRQKGKTRFVNRIAKKCGVQPYTVWRWLRGDYEPSKDEYKNKIAELLGLSVEQLFPSKEEKEA